jgi:salicylate hydroxylase
LALLAVIYLFHPPIHHLHVWTLTMLPPWCLEPAAKPAKTPESTVFPFPHPIAIIGGGLAGLCTSICLTRLNIPHTIFEAKESSGELGFGVAYSPNAAAALSLISPDLRRCYDECAVVEPDPANAATWLNYRVGMAGGITRAGQPLAFGDLIAKVEAFGYEGKEHGRASVHRAEFLNKIIALIPPGIAHFNKRVTGITDLDNGVQLTFSNCTTTLSSCVLDCSGIFSLLRSSIPSAPPAVFAGEYAYRRLVSREEADAILGPDLAGSGNIFCGYGGYVTTYPVGSGGNSQGGSFVNVVAIRQARDTDSPWPTQDAPPDEQHPQPPRPQLLLPCTCTSMLSDFSSFGVPILRLLSSIPSLHRWALCHCPAAPTYFHGRLCLLGDAAHGTTPHQGTGAGLAAEDAFLISHLLAQVQHSDEVTSTLRAFDALQRERGNRLVASSREASRVFSFEDAALGDDLEKVGEDLRERHSWIWEVDLRGRLEEGVKVMEGLVAEMRAERDSL